MARRTPGKGGCGAVEGAAGGGRGWEGGSGLIEQSEQSALPVDTVRKTQVIDFQQFKLEHSPPWSTELATNSSKALVQALGEFLVAREGINCARHRRRGCQAVGRNEEDRARPQAGKDIALTHDQGAQGAGLAERVSRHRSARCSVLTAVLAPLEAAAARGNPACKPCMRASSARKQPNEEASKQAYRNS